jgi:hypothetical protein
MLKTYENIGFLGTLNPEPYQGMSNLKGKPARAGNH